MDIGQFDLREAADQEYWIQLRVGDRLLFNDMKKQESPLRVKVASVAKPGVEDAVKSVTRAARMAHTVEAQLAVANRQQKVALETRLDEIERTTEKALTRFLLTAVLDWENIERGKEALPFSKDALAELSEKGAPLYRMAMAIAEDVAVAMDPFSGAATA